MTSDDTSKAAHAGRHLTLPIHDPRDLGWARRTLADASVAAGIGDDRAAKLALAMTEIATNALEHGDGTAHLEIVTRPDSVTVEISDHGAGLPADRVAELPPPSQPQGRGLWLAEHLCDRVDLIPAPHGTRVALIMYR